MKKLALVCGILASVVSITMGVMSKEEWDRASDNCFLNKDKSACEALINHGLPSVEQCDKDTCYYAGAVYVCAERYREAMPYLEKAIALRNNNGYGALGSAYDGLQDYYNAKKYYEIACNKGNGGLVQAENCYNLGQMYYKGEGVRQDYHKAFELYKKACDIKNATACNNLGFLYGYGKGVRQNESIAKQYFGKACDLGNQMGCDNYRKANEQGVR